MTATIKATLALCALIVLTALPAPTAAAAPEPGTYRLVPDRATARFIVASPLGRMTARMRFEEGSLSFAPGGDVEAVRAVLRADSVRASRSALDTLLRGRSGLDTARHPLIRFEGTGARDGDRLVLEGNLTIRGVTRPARFEGPMTVRGPRRIVMTLESRIDRTAFGITAGRPLYSRFATVRLRLVAVRRRQR
jgi:polyisoprenoid-binding protein YceI